MNKLIYSPNGHLTELDRIFDFFFQPTQMVRSSIEFDQHDYDDKVEIFGALPGYEKKDISLLYEGGVLTIKGKLSDTSRAKITKDSFSYTLSIDEKKYDVDAIEANFKNGILTIVLMKLEKAKPKQIKIK